MEPQEALFKLGLSEGEIKVYTSLLKLGSVPVSRIKEETGLHRTTVYDFVEKLLQKGLVNYVVQNNVSYYNAADPSKLKEFLKEKEEALQEVMPQLIALTKGRKEEVKVEVYNGKEGLKTVMMESIKIGENIVGMGIDDGLFKKALPVFVEQYQKYLKEKNIHERILTKINSEYLFDSSNTHYKYIPSEFFSPMFTLVYGNKVQITIWEPSLTTLLVESEKLAESYREHFEALWKQESMIFQGEEEVKAVYTGMIKTLKKGQEYLAFGIPPIPKKWVSFFDQFCQQLEEKGVKSRVMIDERDKDTILATGKWPSVTIKPVSKEYMTPSEVSIYGDNVAIVLWDKRPRAFVIHNKKIAESFKKYFSVMWKTIPIAQT